MNIEVGKSGIRVLVAVFKVGVVARVNLICRLSGGLEKKKNQVIYISLFTIYMKGVSLPLDISTEDAMLTRTTNYAPPRSHLRNS